MNGAECLVRTAAAAGVRVWFANPGTTEMPLVAALDAVPEVRAILGLFEGVCTGAADGYGRMAERPAATLLHLGPGFANGIANLHNARRARSPLVNVIGDHATWHLPFDAPLSSDIASLAAPVSGWLRSTQRPEDLAGDMAEAIAAAGTAPGRVATLIAPADCQWEEAGGPRAVRAAAAPVRRVDTARIDAVAATVRGAENLGFLLGGSVLREPGLRAAARISAARGARLICETFPARLERGPGLPQLERLPYFPEPAIESLAGLDVLVLAGARAPVAFFGYDGVPSELADPQGTVVDLAPDDGDAVEALEALADSLGAGSSPPPAATGGRPGLPDGALDPGTLGQTLAALQPEGAVVMDEGATSGLPYFLAAAAAPPHTFLTLTGGAIGQGLPCATGAAVACPGRKVIALQADGSALYTLQALWTQAREGLDVVTVICANRSYRILQIEMARAGIAEPGPTARSLTDLGQPPIDWIELSRGFGVPAGRAESCEELIHALRRAFAEPGPALIEALLD